ncbi:MAG: hypothetical protein ACM3NQ_01475 [Bacteroidales bacterium]
MAAPRFRAAATVALIVLAIALVQGGLRVSVFCAGSTHAEACGGSCGDVADPDFSPLVCVVPAGAGQYAFNISCHVVATQPAPAREGFHPAVDRPPSL